MTHQTNVRRRVSEFMHRCFRHLADVLEDPTTKAARYAATRGVLASEQARYVASEMAAQYAAERDQLRAQLAALKDGQAGGEVVGWMWRYDSCGHAVTNRATFTDTPEPTQFLKNVFARGPVPLYTATPKPGPMTEWQPIETAPKDGTELIGWRDDCGVILIRWTSCDAFMSEREIESSRMDEETLFQQDWFCADFIAGCRLDGSETPTHWMPLPPPPTNGISEVRG